MGDRMTEEPNPQSVPHQNSKEEPLTGKVRNEMGGAGRFDRSKEEGSENDPRKEAKEGVRKENEEKDTQVDQRQTYQCRPVRLLGERGNGKMEPYDAEEHGRLGICADSWAIGEMGHGILSVTPYLCQMLGRYSHPERTTRNQSIEGAREGISAGYWYLSTKWASVRHRRISPFGPYEGLMWGNRQQSNPERHVWDMQEETRSVREPGRNGAQNPY